MHVCIFALVFLLTCNLIVFNADVNWLPGSASPHGTLFQAASKYF